MTCRSVAESGSRLRRHGIGLFKPLREEIMKKLFAIAFVVRSRALSAIRPLASGPARGLRNPAAGCIHALARPARSAALKGANCKAI